MVLILIYAIRIVLSAALILEFHRYQWNSIQQNAEIQFIASVFSIRISHLPHHTESIGSVQPIIVRSFALQNGFELGKFYFGATHRKPFANDLEDTFTSVYALVILPDNGSNLFTGE